MDDYCGFLDNVWDLRCYEFKECVDALACGGFNLDSEFTDGADSFAYKSDASMKIISNFVNLT